MPTFTPGAMGVRTQYNYVSTLGAVAGITDSIHKPSVGDQLVERFGTQLIDGLLSMVGAKKPVSALQYLHYEEDRIMPKIKATSVGQSAGVAATFTMASASTLTYGQNAPYSQSGTTYDTKIVPARTNDLILIKPVAGTISSSTYIRAIITSVNASAGTFVAVPLDINDSIPTISAADEIVITGNAFGEGSATPIGRSSNVLEYHNNLQIMREAFVVTGSEKDVIDWFEVTNPETGKSGWGYYIKGEKDCYIRALNFREANDMVSEKITNWDNIAAALGNYTSQTVPTGPIKTTEGLIPAVLGGGTVTNYSGVTGWTLADLEAYTIEADKQKASKENMVFAGISLSLMIDNELRNNFQNGAITFGGYDFGKDASVNLQFDSFKMGNYIFHKKTYDLFNDVQLLGADGYTFRNEGIVIPAGMTSNPKTKEKVPSIMRRYLDGEGDNRDMKHIYRSMLEITGEDIFVCEYISESGLEINALNKFGYWKQA